MNANSNANSNSNSNASYGRSVLNARGYSGYGQYSIGGGGGGYAGGGDGFYPAGPGYGDGGGGVVISQDYGCVATAGPSAPFGYSVSGFGRRLVSQQGSYAAYYGGQGTCGAPVPVPAGPCCAPAPVGPCCTAPVPLPTPVPVCGPGYGGGYGSGYGGRYGSRIPHGGGGNVCGPVAPPPPPPPSYGGCGECNAPVYSQPFYGHVPAPAPVTLRSQGVRVASPPVNVPPQVVYIQGPPVWVDAPPVNVAPAQIYLEAPNVRVRPSEVTVAPPEIHYTPAQDHPEDDCCDAVYSSPAADSPYVTHVPQDGGEGYGDPYAMQAPVAPERDLKDYAPAAEYGPTVGETQFQ